jgi:hypothetical protein
MGLTSLAVELQLPLIVSTVPAQTEDVMTPVIVAVYDDLGVAERVRTELVTPPPTGSQWRFREHTTTT